MNFQDWSKSIEIIYMKSTNAKILFSGKLQTFRQFTKSFLSWSWDYGFWIFSKIISGSLTSWVIEGRMHQISVFFFFFPTIPLHIETLLLWLVYFSEACGCNPQQMDGICLSQIAYLYFWIWYPFQRGVSRVLSSSHKKEGHFFKQNHCNHM